MRDVPEPADQILFLDDNQECIDAAEKVGLVAQKVRGITEVKQAIAKISTAQLLG